MAQGSANASRLYVSRKDGGEGFVSVEEEEVVHQSIVGLENYIFKSTETLLSAVRAIGECGLDSRGHFKKRKQKERKDEWSQKVMHS